MWVGVGGCFLSCGSCSRAVREVGAGREMENMKCIIYNLGEKV